MTATDDWREPKQHTLNHRNCPACRSANELAIRKASMSALGLREASEIWLSQKAWKRRKPKTIECCHGYIHALTSFFGDIPLNEINAGSLLAYQTARSKSVGASLINHEINALSQILKQAGLWDKIKNYYAPLAEPEWKPPKVFTFEEQQRIFSFAEDDPNLELADIVFTITRNTSASGSELRLSRIGSVSLDSKPPIFRVTGDTTKNRIRPRVIPLNDDAEKAFRRALDRAARLGAYREYHYLFPLRVNRAVWDPMRPASRSWLRKQTAKLRERSGVQHLQPHAWRHQFATELLEAGVPDQTVISLCGWVSRKMFETYGHTRIQAKLDALKVLDRIGPEGGQPKNILQFPKNSA